MLTKTTAILLALVLAGPLMAGEYIRNQKSTVTAIVVPQTPQHTEGFISRSVLTTRIENHEPVSNLNRVETSFDRLIAYSEVVNCKGCTIKHEWWKGDEKYYSGEATVRSPHYRWWNYKDLALKSVGSWTVKVYLDGVLMRELPFDYYQPTQVQEQKQDIQQRLELKSIEECRRQLGFFRAALNAAPNDSYYNFMYQKWLQSCQATK